MVDAVPMSSDTAKEKGYRIGNVSEPADGFEVTYPDGYKSWSPADVFGSSYFRIKDDEGSKIMPEDVDMMLIKRQPKKIGTKTTLVQDTTLTGFDMTATSACVDPANFDLNIGADIARKDIIDTLWGHMGFVLQWAKYGLNREFKMAIENTPAHVARMLDEYNELYDRTFKLTMFIRDNPMFNNLADDEQERMVNQCDAMIDYLTVLTERITATGYIVQGNVEDLR